MFGNRLLAQQHIDVDVGYTDDLIGLSQWPAVVTGYRFAGTPGAATVEVGVALDASAYVPAPGEVFTPVAAPGTASLPVGVAAQATAHRDRYAAVFWQLSHDLAAEVTTTVDNTAHPADVAALAAFASGAWSYLATVAGTTQLTAITAAHDTLASIAATYQVSAAELAQANRSPAQSFAAASLLNPSATIAVERRYTAVANDTLAGIAQRSPVPADPAGLAAGNPALALQPGTLLALGTVRTVVAGDTLASIAAAAGLDRTQLASANGPVTGLLEPGTAITPDYQAVVGDTLAGIAGRLSLTLREVAAAVDAAGAGALVPGAGIVVPLPVPSRPGIPWPAWPAGSRSPPPSWARRTPTRTPSAPAPRSCCRTAARSRPPRTTRSARSPPRTARPRATWPPPTPPRAACCGRAPSSPPGTGPGPVTRRAAWPPRSA